MPQHIHCTVENCFYWEQGNHCLAKEILVTSDTWAGPAPESLDANTMMEVAAEVGGSTAQSCMSTCCKTFHDKNKGSTPPIPKLSADQVPSKKS